MDFVDLGWKLASLVATTYGVWKGMHELFLGRRTRARDEYRFTKDFFTDLANNPNMHPYQKEKGYRAIAGTDTLSAEAIEYLLTLESPERALADYSLGHPYLDHLPHAGDLQISFKKSFESSRSRTLRKILYISLYGVFAFVAAAPFLVGTIWLQAPGYILVTLAITMCASGSYAFLAAKAGLRIQAAERLIKQKHKHTQRILLDEKAATEVKPTKPQIQVVR